MYVRTFALRDFRSWETASVDLTPGPTVFVGPNGHGKTNLIERSGTCRVCHRIAWRPILLSFAPGPHERSSVQWSSTAAVN